MRKLIALLMAAIGLAAIVAGSAVAFPPDGDGYQTMSPYRCPPFGAGQPTFDTASPIRVKYGWGATQQSMLDQFLKVQSGTVTVKDAGGNTVVNDTWGVGNAAGWSAYFPQTLLPPGGGTTLNGWQTKKYTNFGTLAAGTYTLNIALSIGQTLSDGPGSTVKKGQWLTISNCSFTVAQAP